MGFLADVSQHLNNLNLRLQGHNQNVVHMYDVIKSFVTMIDVWSTCLVEANFFHFPCLLSLTESDISEENLNRYVRILEKLKSEFVENRLADFRVMQNDFSLLANPFTVDLRNVRSELQTEVASLQCDTFLKSRCNNLFGVDVFKILDKSKYPLLKSFSISIISMFGSTYICEQFFSKMKYVKSKGRSRLTDEHLFAQLKIATYDGVPDFTKLITNTGK